MKKTKKIKRKIKKRKKKILKLTKQQKYLILLFLLFFSLIVIAVVSSLLEPPLDDRPARIERYFQKYNMPLIGHGKTFVEVADSCGMDWRLLPAIAVRESSGGKHMQLNNPFGWGGAWIPFESIDDAIREVGRNLCGLNSSTAKWYGTTSTRKKLFYYNGTVIPTYPEEVMWIMDQF